MEATILITYAQEARFDLVATISYHYELLWRWKDGAPSSGTFSSSKLAPIAPRSKCLSAFHLRKKS